MVRRSGRRCSCNRTYFGGAVVIVAARGLIPIYPFYDSGWSCQSWGLHKRVRVGVRLLAAFIYFPTAPRFERDVGFGRARRAFGGSLSPIAASRSIRSTMLRRSLASAILENDPTRDCPSLVPRNSRNVFAVRSLPAPAGSQPPGAPSKK